MQLCEEMDAEHTCLLLYTEVGLISKGRSLARVFELWEPLQRFLLKKQSPLAAHFSDTEWVTNLLPYVTYSTCSLNSISHFRGEQQLYSSQQIKYNQLCIQGQTRIMGAMSEHGDFWHVSNIRRDFERDWAGPSFSQLLHISYLSFQKSLRITSQLQKIPKLGRIESVTHLWISQVNWLCPC